LVWVITHTRDPRDLTPPGVVRSGGTLDLDYPRSGQIWGGQDLRTPDLVRSGGTLDLATLGIWGPRGSGYPPNPVISGI
jgi:hypothetical protein